MKIVLDARKDALGNLNALYDSIKKTKLKVARACEELEKSKVELAKLEKQKPTPITISRSDSTKSKPKHLRFLLPGGFELLCGRNAGENDELYSKQLRKGDLFFHADIQGAAACVLKKGENSPQEVRLMAAQVSASFSNAWKNGNAVVDVYCVSAEQVTKHAQGGFIPKGGFGITGKREWFSSTPLGLGFVLSKTGELECLPLTAFPETEFQARLYPGFDLKEKILEKLCKHFSVSPELVSAYVPSGKSKVVFKNR